MDAGDRSVDIADQPCPIGLYIQRKEANVNRQVNQVVNKRCQTMVRAMREIRQGGFTVPLD